MQNLMLLTRLKERNKKNKRERKDCMNSTRERKSKGNLESKIHKIKMLKKQKGGRG